MTEYDLLDAIGGIDERFVRKAAEEPIKKKYTGISDYFSEDSNANETSEDMTKIYVGMRWYQKIACIAVLILGIAALGIGGLSNSQEKGNNAKEIPTEEAAIGKKIITELFWKKRTIAMGLHYYAWIRENGTVQIEFSSQAYKDGIVPGVNVGDTVSSWKNVVSLRGALDDLSGVTEKGELMVSPNREFDMTEFEVQCFFVHWWPHWESFLTNYAIAEAIPYANNREVVLSRDGELFCISHVTDTPENILVATDVVQFEDNFYLKKDGTIGVIGESYQYYEEVLQSLNKCGPIIRIAAFHEGVFAITSEGKVVLAAYPWAYHYDYLQWNDVVDIRAASGIVVALCKDGTIRYSAPGHTDDPGLEVALTWNNIVEIEVSLNGNDILARTADGEILLATGKESMFSMK